MTTTLRENCRACAGSMTDVLSLGDIIPVDFIAEGEEIRATAPLTLAQCDACDLVQLRHTVHRDTLYRRYWYLSGLNPSMVDALHDVQNGIRKRIDLHDGDTVIDIGANDGTLLSFYPEGVIRVGFDPALNLAEQAESRCDRFINDYFETSDVEILEAKVITSIAMFYDLEDPGLFLRKIANELRPNGIWVMQMTDLVRMMKANAFDNICHEHLCYYPFGVFKRLAEKFGLEVFDVEFNDVNGGSIRCYVGHREQRVVQESVDEALREEDAYLTDDAMRKFATRVEDAKNKIVSFVHEQRAAGKTFHALGASTKGNTLLQYFGLTSREIEMAAEVNASKYGLRMVGSDVPIVSQEASLAAKPDYYLVLPWHFTKFFLKSQAAYLASGGQLLAPLPEPTIHAYHAKHL